MKTLQRIVLALGAFQMMLSGCQAIPQKSSDPAPIVEEATNTPTVDVAGFLQSRGLSRLEDLDGNDRIGVTDAAYRLKEIYGEDPAVTETSYNVNLGDDLVLVLDGWRLGIGEEEFMLIRYGDDLYFSSIGGPENIGRPESGIPVQTNTPDIPATPTDTQLPTQTITPTASATPEPSPTLDVPNYLQGSGYTLYQNDDLLTLLGALGLSINLDEGISPSVVSSGDISADIDSRTVNIGPNGEYTITLYYGDEGVYAPTYRVKEGDTLGRIGSESGVPWQIIAAANLINDPGKIGVGQEIVIPEYTDGMPIPTLVPTPTSVYPTATPRPSCDCNPDNIVVFYTGGGDRNVNDLHQACIGAGINLYVINHPDEANSLPIEGVTDVVLIGHDTTLRKYDLGRFSGLKPRLTYMATCNAVTFGNSAGSTGVIYATGNNLGGGGGVITYLSRLMKGTRSSDLNGDGLIYTSEFLESYRRLSALDESWTMMP